MKQQWQEKVAEDKVAVDKHFHQEHHKTLDRIGHKDLYKASESYHGSGD